MLISAGRTGLLRPQQCPRTSAFRQHRHVQTVVVHARKRRQQSDAEEDEVPEQQQPDKAEEPAVVRSSRRSVSSRRSARDTRATKKLVTPHQALREMGIIAVDANGKPFVDVSCLGRGEPQWYAIGLLENKEPRFLELLGNTLDGYGLSHDFSKLYEPPAPGDAAAQATADALLQEYDVVAWTPKKTAWVYSHNLDRLVEREIRYGRGTGGGTVLLHMRLDPLLFDVVSNTYYFQAWRHEQEVSARLLYQADLLPSGQELDEVYLLPVPCSDEFMAEIAQWQHTEEAEDEDAMRKEFYGLGGGTTFGESERYDKNKKNLDKDEDGNTIYNKGYAGNYNNPNRWSSGPSDKNNSMSGRGRGRGRGRESGRGWGQQQQQQQPWDMQQMSAARGSYDDGGSYGGYNSGGRGRGRQQLRGSGQYQSGRGRQQEQQQRGGWSGPGSSSSFDQGDAKFDPGFRKRDPSVRQRQMQWMEEMGSGRYSDGEGSDAEYQQPGQQGGRSNRGVVGGRDDSVRLQQMDLMKEMGSGRYSDDGDIWTGGSDDDWVPGPPAPRRNAAASTQGRGAAAAAPPGTFGGRGDNIRRQQMDYMEEMGSGRYSDDEGPDAFDQRTARASTRGAVGGRDGSVRMQQMDWMGELGSGRYSDLDDDEFSIGSSFDSPSSSSTSSRPTQRNNREIGRNWQQQQQQQQQQRRDWQAKSGAGTASYMDEGSFTWGQDADDGGAAARHLHNTWRQDSGEVIVDNDLKNDIAAALGASLADLPKASSGQQQRQQTQQGSAGTSGRKGTGANTAAADRLSADSTSDADGFEEGWVDRMMADGNDRAGLDDVMRQ